MTTSSDMLIAALIIRDIEGRPDEMLAHIWSKINSNREKIHSLECWWPELQKTEVAYPIMVWIKNKIGEKECLRDWNVNHCKSMSNDEFNEWWAAGRPMKS